MNEVALSGAVMSAVAALVVGVTRQRPAGGVATGGVHRAEAWRGEGGEDGLVDPPAGWARPRWSLGGSLGDVIPRAGRPDIQRRTWRLSDDHESDLGQDAGVHRLAGGRPNLQQNPRYPTPLPAAHLPTSHRAAVTASYVTATGRTANLPHHRLSDKVQADLLRK